MDGYKVVKEYVETVLDKESTHFGAKYIDKGQGIVVGDLICEGEMLATDRYYPTEEMLTPEEIEEMESDVVSS